MNSVLTHHPQEPAMHVPELDDPEDDRNLPETVEMARLRVLAMRGLLASLLASAGLMGWLVYTVAQALGARA